MPRTDPSQPLARLKVMTIVGTRPEVIKLSRVIAALDRYTEHVLVHSGQNYDFELNEIFFQDLGLTQPKYVLGVAGSTVAQVIGDIISKSDEVMERERPDALLLYGDTNTCLSVISAKRRKIPIFHMEAGNRCFDQRVPEELNRKLVDHLSDINLPLTEHARRYLLSEGIRPETVIKTGSTMPEILTHYRERIERSSILSTLHVEPKRYFLVSAHREENVDTEDRLRAILEALRGIVTNYGLPVIVSTHPRTRKRLEALGVGEDALGNEIHFLKPFGLSDYVKLELNAFCVLSDSGTVTEEAAILSFPAVTLRQAHERPEGMDAGVLIMSDLRTDRVLQAIRIITSDGHFGRRPKVQDYEDLQVSTKVVRIIQSYVDYVNRTVWGKAVR